MLTIKPYYKKKVKLITNKHKCMEETKFRNQVCKDNPFKVPDGYFARLQEDIMAKLP